MTATQIPDFDFEFKTDDEKKPMKHKKLIITLCVILVFIITLVSTFFIMVKVGEAKLRKSLVAGETLTGTGADMDENAIYHNGKTYYYNENLINILLIGVDEYEGADKSKPVQADALYLVSVDTETNQVKITSISRNTMCDIGVINAEGEVVGTEHKQICLSYAYSKDDVKSSENCVRAVSELLYNIPINGYYTVRMSSIKQVVNAVGGVKVQIGPDAKDTEFANKIGTTVNLKGDDVLVYLRMRGDSNAPRVERHKQFISSFVNSAKIAVKRDLSLPFDIANKISKDAVTDVNISSMVYLATEALNWKMDFVNIKGEYGIENELETFTIDEEALKEVIIGNFYIAK